MLQLFILQLRKTEISFPPSQSRADCTDCYLAMYVKSSQEIRVEIYIKDFFFFILIHEFSFWQHVTLFFFLKTTFTQISVSFFAWRLNSHFKFLVIRYRYLRYCSRLRNLQGGHTSMPFTSTALERSECLLVPQYLYFAWFTFSSCTPFLQ